jgi:hypothetical protein
MANTRSYPSATAKSDDLILGTSMPLPNTNDDPRTVNFSIGQINGLANLTLSGGTGSGEYLQLISASILPGGGAIGSGYTWDAAGAFISWNNTATNNKIIIPQLQLPDGGASPQDPYTIAAEDGSYRRGADLILGTATDPIIAGTPNGTLTINLTYRLFPQS